VWQQVRHLLVDGKKVKCQVWDTAGQEKFHVITRTYYKGAHGIALIYDVTDPDSFKNVNYWMANIQQHADEKVLTYVLAVNHHNLNAD
jgi:small GTP-binding protein